MRLHLGRPTKSARWLSLHCGMQMVLPKGRSRIQSVWSWIRRWRWDQSYVVTDGVRVFTFRALVIALLCRCLIAGRTAPASATGTSRDRKLQQRGAGRFTDQKPRSSLNGDGPRALIATCIATSLLGKRARDLQVCDRFTGQLQRQSFHAPTDDVCRRRWTDT